MQLQADKLTWAARIFCGLAIVLGAVSAYLHLQLGFNNDTMLLMAHTEKMLAGQTAYRDFMDVNPPLVYGLFMLPLLFSKLTGLAPAFSLNVFGLVVAAGSLFLCAQILSSVMFYRLQRQVIIAALSIGLLVISFMHQLFADREFLVLALILPLLVMYAPPVNRQALGRNLRVLVYVLAAIGFALKPYTLAIYIALQLYRVYAGLSPRALLREKKHYIIGGILLTYALTVLLFFSDYIFVFLPIASDTYGAINWPWASKLQVVALDLWGGYAVTGLLLTVLLWMLAPASYSRIITYLLVLMVGATFSYGLSGGWYYTRYPFMVFSFLLAVAAFAHLLPVCARQKDREHKYVSAFLLCALTAICLWSYFGKPVTTQLHWDRQLLKTQGRSLHLTPIEPQAYNDMRPYLTHHPRFIWLGNGVWAPYVTLKDPKAQHVGRFDYAWPVPGLIRLSEQQSGSGRYEALRSWYARSVAEDIVRGNAELIINDVSPSRFMIPTGYNILNLLRFTPEAAEPLRAFARVATINRCTAGITANCAYEIYVRADVMQKSASAPAATRCGAHKKNDPLAMLSGKGNQRKAACPPKKR